MEASNALCFLLQGQFGRGLGLGFGDVLMATEELLRLGVPVTVGEDI